MSYANESFAHSLQIASGVSLINSFNLSNNYFKENKTQE